jgi:beta-xylosidase
MMDANAIGRLTALSPVTWKDGWPYFGLPGNLGRTPRVWVKPALAPRGAPACAIRPERRVFRPASGERVAVEPRAQRQCVVSDERPGHLRLHSMPAPDFWSARNSLTQRAVGPRSSATTVLDAAGMRAGDVAGLALLNRPYAWIGVRRTDDGLALQQYDQTVDSTARRRCVARGVWLRVDCDFLTEEARFAYSTDGARWTPLGDDSRWHSS